VVSGVDEVFGASEKVSRDGQISGLQLNGELIRIHVSDSQPVNSDRCIENLNVLHCG
jgi:hypothetical protein